MEESAINFSLPYHTSRPLALAFWLIELTRLQSQHYFLYRPASLWTLQLIFFYLTEIDSEFRRAIEFDFFVTNNLHDFWGRAVLFSILFLAWTQFFWAVHTDLSFVENWCLLNATLYHSKVGSISNSGGSWTFSLIWAQFAEADGTLMCALAFRYELVHLRIRDLAFISAAVDGD